jgi:exosome complex exonuclease RRP6
MNCSHRACQLGDLEMCKILHSYKVNWEAQEKEGMTPMHYAVQAGNFQLVKYLVEEANVNVEAKDIQ